MDNQFSNKTTDSREAAGKSFMSWCSGRRDGGFHTLLFLLVIFLAVQIFSDLKQFRFIGRDNLSIATITVPGKGEVLAVPDIGKVTATVISEGKEPSAVQANAARDINSVIDGLKSAGVASKDIKTVNYFLSPRYALRPITLDFCISPTCPPRQSEIIGYEVSQSIEVTIRDLSKAGDLVSLAGKLGAKNISGVQFTVEDEEGFRDGARAKAIDEAKQKARVLARELDVRLVRLLSFSSGGDFHPFFGKTSALGIGGDAVSLPPTPELPVGENKITVFVNLTYEIR